MSDKPKDTPPAKEEAKEVPLYSVHMWKGVLQVCQCQKCEFSCEAEDDMKLHVLTHFEPQYQATVLEKLVTMKGVG